MNRDEYILELRRRLKYRAVPRQRVDEILAEVKDHLDQSGEEPLESFGPPDRYAARLVRGRWHTPRSVVSIVAAMAAAGLGSEVAAAFQHGEPMVTVAGSMVVTGAVFVPAAIVAVLPAVHNRFPRPGTHVLFVMVFAALAACVASWVGDVTGFDARELFTLSRATGLVAAMALAAVAGGTMAGPYLVRLRGRRLAANRDRA